MAETELTPSVPKETPSEEPAKPAVVVETPAADPAKPEMFKLPDGREVDAAGLKAEYEKLLPEFTRKSQALAALTGDKDPNINNLPEWKREGYVPKSYAEIIEIAEKQALEKIASASEAEEKHRTEIAAKVDADVAALKAKDPKLDENALFAHANKYGFRNLALAYENMQEIKKVATVTEERVLQGAKKKIDPIATGGASGGGSQYRYAPATNAVEFLSRMKGK